MSFLMQEILQQPRVLTELIELEWPRIRSIKRDIEKRDIKYVFIVARGSSDNAARYGKYLFSAINRLPVALAAPSLFTRYHLPPYLDSALVIGISQSGRSIEAIEVLNEARNQGAYTLAITNDADSPLAREAGKVILCHAEEERSLAATKTFTAQLAALALLSSSIAGDERLVEALRSIPRAMDATLALDEHIEPISQRYSEMNRCIVIGRGYNFAIAHEVALKLKELTYVVAEPHSSADLRHGPVAIMTKGFPAMVFALSGDVYDDVVELIKELRSRGVDPLIISDREEAVAGSEANFLLPVTVPEWLSPLISVIPGQLFTLHLAQAKGIDPDHPRGLSKVTITR